MIRGAKQLITVVNTTQVILQVNWKEKIANPLKEVGMKLTMLLSVEQKIIKQILE